MLPSKQRALVAPDSYQQSYFLHSGAQLLQPVWGSYQQLHAFTYRSAHGSLLRERRRWFEKIEGPTTVLWWVPAGHRPTLEEGAAHLRFPRRCGPTRSLSQPIRRRRRRRAPTPRAPSRRTSTRTSPIVIGRWTYSTQPLVPDSAEGASAPRSASKILPPEPPILLSRRASYASVRRWWCLRWLGIGGWVWLQPRYDGRRQRAEDERGPGQKERQLTQR